MAKRKSRARRKGNFWQRMDLRSRMFFVLALCSGALLITVIAAFAAVHTAGAAGPKTPEDDSTVVSGSDYDQNANSIDAAQFEAVILPETADAGQEYIDNTLFLGDSNTARMYRMFDYCSYENAIGSVGMAARQLEDYACVKFAGYSGYKTMPEAVALMQPQRVIITFGTNDAGTETDEFIAAYEAGIQAVQAAYPSVDIIVNAVPPIGRSHIGSHLDQSQLDAYNHAIAQMCEDNGWKFLNSAPALKGDDGYAKSDYVEADGIHLTASGMDALFAYIRTHSYVTEDDRPALTEIPEHTDDKDVSVQTAGTVVAPSSQAASSQAAPTATPAPTPEPTPVPDSSSGGTVSPPLGGGGAAVVPSEPAETPTPEPTPEPTPAPTPAPTPTPTPEPTPPPAPTPTPAPDPTPTPASEPEQGTDNTGGEQSGTEGGDAPTEQTDGQPAETQAEPGAA